ncbi:MAG TPA: hypothetical protein VKF82_09265 [Candidatus Eremiobacteraceae bacterium]|nr:hypothetical protein [Candidatus Eremiobacteraceae bacterium]
MRSGASALWYGVGALVIVAGMIASVFGALGDFKSLQTAFARVVVPGSDELHLSKPGTYVIYYEYRSDINGEIFETPETTDIKCSIVSRTGRTIEIVPASLNAEYDFGGRAGKAIAQFVAPDAGMYVINCDYAGGKGTRIALAIAPPVAAGFIASFFKWLALAFASLGFGLIILIVTLVRRAGPGPRPTLQ